MTNEYAVIAFWICTTILGIMGFVLSLGGLLLPWEWEGMAYTVGIMTGGATWAVYGCVLMLAGLFALIVPKSSSVSPALMAAGSLLIIFSAIYSFFHAYGNVSYGMYVSLIGAIITCIGAIFSALYVKFKEMAK